MTTSALMTVLEDRVPVETFHRLLADWQWRLHLNAWKVAIVFSNGDVIGRGHRIALMTVARSEFYKNATITISSHAQNPSNGLDCVEMDLVRTGVRTHEHVVECALVHELLHLAVRDMMEAGDLVRDQLSSAAISVWDGAWSRAEEAFVESMAVALVTNWGQTNGPATQAGL